MLIPELRRKLLRFGLVGGTVTAVFMGLNALFGRWMEPDPAYLAAYPLAVGLHFILSKWWTFGDRSAVRPRQVTEYLVLMAVAFVIQTVVFKGLVYFTPIRPWIASGLATVLQMGISFLTMQRRVFAASG